MNTILTLLGCGGLVGLGAFIWYRVERRTERLVGRERIETEAWRGAYIQYRLRGVTAPWETVYMPNPLGDQPKPDPLLMNEQDQRNLETFGRTGRKRIHEREGRA
jgi:hypothetical protein